MSDPAEAAAPVNPEGPHAPPDEGPAPVHADLSRIGPHATPDERSGTPALPTDVGRTGTILNDPNIYDPERNCLGQPEALAAEGVLIKYIRQHRTNWNAKLRPMRNCSAKRSEQLHLNDQIQK